MRTKAVRLAANMLWPKAKLRALVESFACAALESALPRPPAIEFQNGGLIAQNGSTIANAAIVNGAALVVKQHEDASDLDYEEDDPGKQIKSVSSTRS